MNEKFTAEKAKVYVDSQETKIRKGQAFNLAINQAIAEKKTNDKQYIFSLFIKYYELAALIQSASIDDIKKVLNN